MTDLANDTGLSESMVTDLSDALAIIMSISWGDMTDPEYPGACIPISYSLNLFFTLRGRPSRVSETAMQARDPLNVQRLEIAPGRDGFMGHVVVLLPTHHLLLDGSLWTQRSKVLANFDIPKLVIAKWTKGMPAYRTIGRLMVQWEPNLAATQWSKGRWPWKTLADAVNDLERMMRE